ncbi:putative protein OS=Sphingobium scionense OX=1404341 GN=GGQ90_002974 PE=4 SV=1 [Sphingobium scionense]|jgi:hypothetical protein|uniref:Uncharacterized protein n=1 Tax=Sphingobium scionense TaxID=1404341 RepID=A0A7W6PV90_9SPHN|nr:hypothetical protein [Sphingobium scionense]
MVECKQQPFALSLSKGSTERSEVSSLRSVQARHVTRLKGFDFAQPERNF